MGRKRRKFQKRNTLRRRVCMHPYPLSLTAAVRDVSLVRIAHRALWRPRMRDESRHAWLLALHFERLHEDQSVLLGTTTGPYAGGVSSTCKDKQNYLSHPTNTHYYSHATRHLTYPSRQYAPSYLDTSHDLDLHISV